MIDCISPGRHTVKRRPARHAPVNRSGCSTTDWWTGSSRTAERADAGRDRRAGADDPAAEPRCRRQAAEVRPLPQRLDLLRLREEAHVRAAPQPPRASPTTASPAPAPVQAQQLPAHRRPHPPGRAVHRDRLPEHLHQPGRGSTSPGSTPSPNPPATRRSYWPGRRRSSKPNRSSSSKPTTPTRSRSTSSRPSRTAFVRACKRSRADSTRWRRPTTRRRSGSSPTSATSTPRPNPQSGGCSTGHCSTASSMTRPPSNRSKRSRRSWLPTPGHTTNKPCPTITRGRVRTFNFTWSLGDSNS